MNSANSVTMVRRCHPLVSHSASRRMVFYFQSDISCRHPQTFLSEDSRPHIRYHLFPIQETSNECRHAFVHLLYRESHGLLQMKYFILNLCPCMGSIWQRIWMFIWISSVSIALLLCLMELGSPFPAE